MNKKVKLDYKKMFESATERSAELSRHYQELVAKHKVLIDQLDEAKRILLNAGSCLAIGNSDDEDIVQHQIHQFFLRLMPLLPMVKVRSK